MDRPNIVKVIELTTDKVSVVHISRLCLFSRHLAEMTPEELEALAGIDVDECFVRKIVDHEEQGRCFTKIGSFVCDGRDMSQITIHGSIGTQSKISPPLKLIVRNRNRNRSRA